MPSSHFFQLNEIVELIVLTQPASILDVGVGFGKYGFLCREYLDVLDGRQEIHNWQRRIDGIEIFKNYITPLQKLIYNHIYFGNALDILPTLTEHYDLILLIDIIEHFDFPDGQKLLQLCQQHGKNIIISTPRIDLPQNTMFGNPYETHRSFYRKRDFRKFSNKIFVFNFFSLIVYLGEQAPFIRKNLHKRRLLFSWPIRLGFKHIVRKMVLKAMAQMFTPKSPTNEKSDGDSTRG